MMFDPDKHFDFERVEYAPYSYTPYRLTLKCGKCGVMCGWLYCSEVPFTYFEYITLLRRCGVPFSIGFDGVLCQCPPGYPCDEKVKQ